MIILSTILSALSYDKYGYLVWLVPLISIIISRVVILIAREVDTGFTEGLATFINMFLIVSLLTLVLLGLGEYFKPGLYAELTKSNTSALFFWILFPGTIIGGSIFLTAHFLNNEPIQPTPIINSTPTPIKNKPTPPIKNKPTPPPQTHTKLFGNSVRYYHGTSIEAAKDVWKSNLWLSKISPAELWMSNDIEIAKDYAIDRGDGKGYILEIYVDPDVKVIQMLSNTFYIPLQEDDSPNKDNYYNVDGVYLYQMLDLNYNVLRRK